MGNPPQGFNSNYYNSTNKCYAEPPTNDFPIGTAVNGFTPTHCNPGSPGNDQHANRDTTSIMVSSNKLGTTIDGSIGTE